MNLGSRSESNERLVLLLIKMFHFHLYFNFEAIFELPGIDLHNRFSILSQFDDLKKSASSTTRPKLWRLGGRWRLKLQTSNWAQNVQEDLPHLENVDSGNSKQLFLNEPTLASHQN